MILLFTGAKEEGQTQTEPRLSLGSYVSGSLVPNGSLNNLFGEISQYTLEKKVVEYRAVALKNTTGAVISGAELWYRNLSNNPLVNIRMAVVTLAQDDCGWYMERIANINAKPLSATFVDNKTQPNAIGLPTINPNEYVGIWIERSFNANAIDEALSCEALIAAYQAEPIQQVETVETVADVADSLNDTYWFLDTPQSQFFVWYDTGTGTMPNIPNREPIRVVIATGDSAIDVATKTSDQINLILDPRGEASATVVTASNVITITMTEPGSSPAPTPETSGFTMAVTTQGVTGTLENVEDVALTVAW